MSNLEEPAKVLRLVAPEAAALARAVEALERGRLIAFPTDTVYGVGAHGFFPKAVQDLYAIKGRPGHMPIPLLVPDAATVELLCEEIPASAWAIMERFWPGALSLVLRRASIVPDAVTAGGPTVAVRMPDQPLICRLMRQLGAPLAATSANPHGRPAPVAASQVQRWLGGRLSLILDGGHCPGGTASTVVDMTTSPPAILRHGPVSAEMLSEAGLLTGD
jgi:L-threonylcarbamoyladenylate synthase